MKPRSSGGPSRSRWRAPHPLHGGRCLGAPDGLGEQRREIVVGGDTIGPGEAPGAVQQHADADAAITVARGALELTVLHGDGLALALDVARVGVAHAVPLRSRDRAQQTTIVENAFRLSLGQTARVPAEAFVRSARVRSVPTGPGGRGVKGPDREGRPWARR